MNRYERMNRSQWIHDDTWFLGWSLPPRSTIHDFVWDALPVRGVLAVSVVLYVFRGEVSCAKTTDLKGCKTNANVKQASPGC